MAVTTSNMFGKITVNDKAIAMVAGYAARECYGVVDLVTRRFIDSIKGLFSKIPYTNGVKIKTENNKIIIDIFAIFKNGVSFEAVTESLKSTVVYNVEQFSGFQVKEINVKIVGVKL